MPRREQKPVERGRSAVVVHEVEDLEEKEVVRSESKGKGKMVSKATLKRRATIE